VFRALKGSLTGYAGLKENKRLHVHVS